MVRLLGISGTKAISVLFLFRLFTAVYLVRTFFDPDEFWQSVEIAHRFVFGYGFETWEWKPFARIRGFAYPGLFAILFKITALLGIDSPSVIKIGPRVVQAVIATIGDAYLYKLTAKWFNERVAGFALLCQVMDWFFLTNIIRTLSNSMETVLTIITLYYWPESLKSIGDRKKALLFAAITVVVRPASALFWLIICFHLFVRCRNRLRLVFREALPIGVSILILSILVDCLYYRTWTFTMWNFVKFNIGSSRCSGAAMYGTHPVHWYITQGLPAMLGTFLPFFILGASISGRWFPLALISLMIALLSANPHKEFRFILPSLPLCFMFCGVAIANLQARFQTRKPFGRLYLPSLVFLFVSNLIAGVYFSRWHQAGPIAVMDYVSDNAHAISSIDFLTSCHSTPFYSHIHQHIPMHILECEPRFEESECVGDRSTSDSEEYLRNPDQFVGKYYDFQKLPSHFVLFDDYYSRLKPFLEQTGYVIERKFFHSYFGDSRYIMLLRQI